MYDWIETQTSCQELAESFDVAMDNVERLPPSSDQRAVSLAYAKAAQDRMADLDC